MESPAGDRDRVSDGRLSVRSADTSGSIVPAYLSSAAEGPDDADTVLSGENTAGPSVQALAPTLATPEEIYRYLYENADYIPYYGSQQGAEMTLMAMAGNDFDLSSLAIALLRENGIPARYVYGAVDVPLSDMEDILKVSSASAVDDLLTKGGIPHTMGSEKVTVEHCWVEYYHGGEWHAMDVSYKPYIHHEGINLEAAMGIDTAAMYDTLSTTGMTDEIRADIEGRAADNLMSYLDQHGMNITDIYSVFGGWELPSYSGALHFENPRVLYESPTLADDYRAFVRVSLGGGEITLPLYAISGKRMTVAYYGATLSDRDAIKKAGFLNRVSGVEMVGIVSIDSVPILITPHSAIGSSQELSIEFRPAAAINAPSTSPLYGSVKRTLVVGGYYVAAVDIQAVPLPYILSRVQRSVYASELNDIVPMPKGEIVGEQMHLRLLALLYDMDTKASGNAHYTGVANVRPHPAVLMMGSVPHFSSGRGTMDSASVFIEMLDWMMYGTDEQGDNSSSIAYALSAVSMAMTAVENAILGNASNTPAQEEHTGLGSMAEHSDSALTITSDNIDDISSLGLPEDEASSIEESVNAGETVIMAPSDAGGYIAISYDASTGLMEPLTEVASTVTVDEVAVPIPSEESAVIVDSDTDFAPATFTGQDGVTVSLDEVMAKDYQDVAWYVNPDDMDPATGQEKSAVGYVIDSVDSLWNHPGTNTVVTTIQASLAVGDPLLSDFSRGSKFVDSAGKVVKYGDLLKNYYGSGGKPFDVIQMGNCQYSLVSMNDVLEANPGVTRKTTYFKVDPTAMKNGRGTALRMMGIAGKTLGYLGIVNDVYQLSKEEHALQGIGVYTTGLIAMEAPRYGVSAIIESAITKAGYGKFGTAALSAGGFLATYIIGKEISVIASGVAKRGFMNAVVYDVRDFWAREYREHGVTGVLKTYVIETISMLNPWQSDPMNDVPKVGARGKMIENWVKQHYASYVKKYGLTNTYRYINRFRHTHGGRFPPFPGNDHPDDRFDAATGFLELNTLEGATERFIYTKGLDHIAALYKYRDGMKGLMEGVDDFYAERENYISIMRNLTGVMEEALSSMELIRDEALRIPDVVVLQKGFYRGVLKVLEENAEPFELVGVDFDPAIAEYNPVLVIPSGGLYGLTPAFRTKLESYASRGGTIVAFAQQSGSDMELLPSGLLRGFGWTEDQSCLYGAVGIAAYHPSLSSQTSSTITANFDGYFTSTPDNTTVFLKRTKNSMPAGVEYRYGKGRVIASTLYTDWAVSYGMDTPSGRDLMRDMIYSARIGEVENDFAPGQSVSFSILIRNTGTRSADTVVFSLIGPDKKVVDTYNTSASVPAGGTAAVEFSHAGLSTPGMYMVDAALLNGDDLVAMDYECGRFTVSMFASSEDGSGFIYKGQDITFGVNSPSDRVTYGSQVEFVITVWNHGDSTRIVNVYWSFPHHYWETGDDVYGAPGTTTPYRAGSNLHRTLTIVGGGKEEIHYTITARAPYDRCWVEVVDSDGNYIGQGSRGFYVFEPTVGINIRSDRKVYTFGSDVSINVSVKNEKRMEISDGTVDIKCISPSGATVFQRSESFSMSPSQDTWSASYTYSLPSDPETGFYTLVAQAYDGDGSKIGYDSGSFEVPSAKVDVSYASGTIIPGEPSPVLFVFQNVGNVLTDSANITMTFRDPGGGTVDQSSFTVHFNGREPVKRKVYINMTGPAVLGTYKLDYSAEYGGRATGGTVEFPCAFDISIVLKDGYGFRSNRFGIGDSITAEVLLSNTGLIDAAPQVDIISPLGHSTTTTITVPSGGKKVFNATADIPDSTAAGDYTVTATLTLGTTVSSQATATVAEARMALVNVFGDREQGGTLSMVVKNTGVHNTTMNYTLSLIDWEGTIVATTGGEDFYDSMATRTYSLAIPTGIVTGQYRLSLSYLEKYTNFQSSAEKAITLYGITGTIAVSTDKKVYAVGESITGTALTDLTNITSGTGAINITVRSESHALRGRIYDASTGKALAGVVVFAGDYTDYSRYDGYYELWLPSGQFTVEYGLYGYAVYRQKVRMIENDIESDVYLEPAPGMYRLTGHLLIDGIIDTKAVNDSQVKRTVPMEGALVTATPLEGRYYGNRVRTTVSDPAGEYIIKDMLPGQYRLRITKGWYHHTAVINISGDTTYNHTFQYANDTTPEIYGYIYDDSGPVQYAEVSAGGKNTTTNAAGYYEFRGVQGSVHISVRAFGRDTYELTAEAGSGPVNIHLNKSSYGSLTGRIIDSGTGRGVAGASVSITPLSVLSSDGFGMTFHTLIDGSYLFRNIPAGTYSISVTHQLYTALTDTVTVAANTTTVRDISLTPSTSVSPVTESEPNGDMGNATPVTPGIPVMFRADTANDYDYFAVTVSTPGRLYSNITDVPSVVNVDNYIKDAGDNDLAYNWWTANGECNNLSVDVPPGTYYILAFTGTQETAYMNLTVNFVPMPDDTEPNGDMGNATPIERNRPYQVTLFSSTGADTDYYHIHVSGYAYINSLLYNVPPDISVQNYIRDSNGNDLAYNWWTANGENNSITAIVGPGDYYITVYSSANTLDTLCLIVNVMEIPLGDEPNNDMGNATPIDSDIEYTDYLFAGNAADTDYYVFTVDSISYVESCVYDIPAGMNVDNYIKDTGGNDLAYNWWSASGENNTISCVVRPGTYYIVLWSDSKMMESVHFRLRITDIDSGLGDSDRMATARPINLGVPYDIGYYPSTASQSVFFSVVVPHSGRATFNAYNVPPSIDLDMYIYDSGGNQISYNWWSPSGENNTHILDIESGLYYIGIYTHEVVLTERFNLMVSLIPADDTNEPNDDTEHATPVVSGESVIAYGLHSSGSDYDWYRFTADRPGTLQVSVKPGSDYDIDLYVYDAGGNTLYYNWWSSPGESQTAIVGVEPGDYYILVYCHVSSVRPYAMDIGFVPSDGSVMPPYTPPPHVVVVYTTTIPADMASGTVPLGLDMSTPAEGVMKMTVDLYSSLGQHIADNECLFFVTSRQEDAYVTVDTRDVFPQGRVEIPYRVMNIGLSQYSPEVMITVNGEIFTRTVSLASGESSSGTAVFNLTAGTYLLRYGIKDGYMEARTLRVADVGDVSVSYSIPSQGILKVRVEVVSTYPMRFRGNVHLESDFFSGARGIDIPAGGLGFCVFTIPINGLGAGEYQISITVEDINGTLFYRGRRTVDVIKPVASVALSGINSSYSAGDRVEGVITVENTGALPGRFNVTLAAEGMYRTAWTVYLDPGSAVDRNFTFMVPDDIPQGEYDISVTAGQCTLVRTVTISGSNVTASGTLDRYRYSVGDAITLTVTVSNHGDRPFNGSVVARYGDARATKVVSASAGGTGKVAFTFTASEGHSRVYYAVYNGDGRSVFISSVPLLVAGGGPIAVSPNAMTYTAGGTVTLDIDTNRTGTLDITFLSRTTEYNITGPTTVNLAIPATIVSGTYAITYEFRYDGLYYRGRTSVDIDGIDASVFVSAGDVSVSPGDTLPIEIRIYSDSDYAAVIDIDIQAPDGSSVDSFQYPVDIYEGTNDISIERAVVGEMAGTYHIIYSVYPTESSSRASGDSGEIASGMISLDMGNAFILSVTTDRGTVSPGDTLSLTVESYCIEPAEATISLDGETQGTIRLPAGKATTVTQIESPATPGMHTVQATVSSLADDGTVLYSTRQAQFTVITQPAEMNLSGSTVLQNLPPVLYGGFVSPASGDENTDFSFTVFYRDAEGDMPLRVATVIDGTGYNMTAAGNGTSGEVRYTYVTKLPAGNHTFYFLCDFNGGRVTLMNGTNPWTLTVKAAPGQGEGGGNGGEEGNTTVPGGEGTRALYYAAALLGIIVVIALVVVVLRRRKEEKPEATPEMPVPEPAPAPAIEPEAEKKDRSRKKGHRHKKEEAPEEIDIQEIEGDETTEVPEEELDSGEEIDIAAIEEDLDEDWEAEVGIGGEEIDADGMEGDIEEEGPDFAEADMLGGEEGGPAESEEVEEGEEIGPENVEPEDEAGEVEEEDAEDVEKMWS